MMWTIASESVNWSNGEVDGEWFIVSDGVREFQAFDQDDAQWLCALLNANDESGDNFST